MFSGMGSAKDTNARWHMLLKGPLDGDVATPLRLALKAVAPDRDITIIVDVDPLGML